MSSERRRAELAEKRAKLAELKAARAERASALSSAASSRPASTLPLEERSTTAEVDDIMQRALGNEYRRSIGPGSGSGRTSRASEQEEGSVGPLASPAPAAQPSTVPSTTEGSDRGSVPVQMVDAYTSPMTLTSSSIELYDLPPRQKVTYDKSIQTSEPYAPSTHDRASSTPDSSGLANGGGAGRETAEEMRARLMAEFEEERRVLDAAIAEETARAAQEAEEARVRGLDAPALGAVLTSPTFLEFLGSSSKIVQRALSDSYDYLRDYTVTSSGEKESEGQKVRLLGSWYEERWGRGRSVTGVQWSPKFPELFVASYNKNPMAVNEPDGIACVWNLHLLERPEFVFHSQSDVLSVSFTPFHPNLLVGGTYSGQILLWDTRSRHPNPVLKTPLSASGHTHPVYSLSMVGTQNAHNLISASTDGTVCGWTLDMLAKPQESIELTHPAHNKTDEVSITALGFPATETATFWVGTEEGNVYAANRYDRAGAKAGLVQSELYRGHSGPVTGIDFHPVEGPVDLSDLFLTSGVDWTVKLWRTGVGAGSGKGGVVSPLMSFEEADDYVYDAKWHPKHPAMFGTVDGSGKFDLWNLNVDTEVPVVSTSVAPSAPRGLNKLAWDRGEGRRAAIGSSDGKVYVYEISQELATPREGDWEQMRKQCSAAAAGAPGSELMGR
ncbi:dynein intermediate chain, cytosolic [Pseudohyphozyma bogoriensis]|nr:dynein intermediate chain, cytosolic [Pseudohyphozyma bogoriensis]